MCDISYAVPNQKDTIEHSYFQNRANGFCEMKPSLCMEARFGLILAS